MVSYYPAFAPKSEAVNYMDYRATLKYTVCLCLWLQLYTTKFGMSVLSCEGEPPNIGVACSTIAMYQSHMGGEKKQRLIFTACLCANTH